MAIGANGEALKSGAMIQKKNAKDPEEKEQSFKEWMNLQNQAFQSRPALFSEAEQAFQTAAAQNRLDSQGRLFSVNVGSWWADIFSQTRMALNAVKNARNWKLTTAFGPRSTISGIGPVVHPQSSQNQGDWITEGETQHYWQRQAGLFDGNEQLNATETVKRGLEKVLPELLKRNPQKLKAYYPDLTVGIAGYLKTQPKATAVFKKACHTIYQQILQDHRQVADSVNQDWGIPWIDECSDQLPHPRLLNAGWLMEELDNLDQSSLPVYRQTIQEMIQEFYPQNNPTNWYVLAAGDGDGMSEWLKGSKMKKKIFEFERSINKHKI